MRSGKACGWIERSDRMRLKCRTRESELDCRQWEITEVQFRSDPISGVYFKGNSLGYMENR